MRVVATKQTFDGTCIRQPGEEYDLPDTTKFDPETDPFKKVDPRAKKQAQDEGQGGEGALA